MVSSIMRHLRILSRQNCTIGYAGQAIAGLMWLLFLIIPQNAENNGTAGLAELRDLAVLLEGADVDLEVAGVSEEQVLRAGGDADQRFVVDPEAGQRRRGQLLLIRDDAEFEVGQRA